MVDYGNKVNEKKYEMLLDCPAFILCIYRPIFYLYLDIRREKGVRNLFCQASGVADVGISDFQVDIRKSDILKGKWPLLGFAEQPNMG